MVLPAAVEDRFVMTGTWPACTLAPPAGAGPERTETLRTTSWCAPRGAADADGPAPATHTTLGSPTASATATTGRSQRGAARLCATSGT